MTKKLLAALWVFSVVGGFGALLSEKPLVGMLMLGFAAFILPTISLLVWIFEENKK